MNDTRSAIRKIPGMLINVTTCNVCGQIVESYAINYNPGEYKEPTICECEGNQLVIRTKEVSDMDAKEVSKKLKCRICAEIKLQNILKDVKPSLMVRTYCEGCQKQQYHEIIGLAGSLIDAFLI